MHILSEEIGKMIIKITKIFFIIALFAFFAGCNSAIYEIVEVEEPVEVVKEEIKEEVKPPVTEIKEDTKPTENKFSEKTVVAYSYFVQLGAFNEEFSAIRVSNTAKNRLGRTDVTVKNIDGLYKIRLNGFTTREEAIQYLDKTKFAGYSDSFYGEVSYLKQENK